MMRAEPLYYIERFDRRLEREGTRPFPAPEEIPPLQALSWQSGICVEIAQGVTRYELGMVLHGSLVSEWPITVHVPSALAGFRHSLGISQVKFADAIATTRLNVERWESGKSRPFRGNIYPLLSSVRSLVDSPSAAGQLFNLAAAAVLPRLTRPAGTYRRQQVREFLTNREGDHGDLTDKLLDLLVDAEILMPVDHDDSSEGAEFIPRVGVQLLDREREPWAAEVIAAAERLSAADRKLWLSLADRLAGTPCPTGTQQGLRKRDRGVT
jgi:transcriptional regulator with XRE-family HTH domain